MIVVADSGPLNYLILLDHAELLHRFTGEVVIPDAVDSDRVHAVTADLDLGERAGIALAGAFHADLLLIDEAAGRAEAKRLKLRVTGTLGASYC
jgi:predicted nucleic acid-binding protein